MIIGYLILAHNCPNHFSRLVHALKDNRTYIYVHIDKKSSVFPFCERVPTDVARFIKDRIRIYWGDFSIVYATINLISEALSRGPMFDYLCLLSGADYPLQSATYIRNFFLQHRGKEFINLLPMSNNTVGKPIERLTTYRFQSGPITELVRRLCGSRLPQLLPHFYRDYRKCFGELQPYAGSQWWALSREACECVLHFACHNPRVVKFFKNTLYPDESFFHTIIGNSPFRSQVVRNLTFTDWSRPAPPYPAIIDQDHIRHFLASPNVTDKGIYGQGELLFARKFPDDSEDLVAQLQARLAVQDRDESAQPQRETVGGTTCWP
jgi:Core-2/I-Branching enzyme